MSDLDTPPHHVPRFSIDQLMMVIGIIALCLAPLMIAARSEIGEKVLGAVAFDALVLPGCGTLAVAMGMRPGPKRSRCLKAFFLTPLSFPMATLTLSAPLIIVGGFILR